MPKHFIQIPHDCLLKIQERFWKRVEKTPSCWIWKGKPCRGGYGRLTIKGLGNLVAHRISWELTFGPISQERLVCHNCPTGDNPLCVNPHHLFLGTYEENMQDASKKGRMEHGSRRYNAKLTEEKVIELRRRRLDGESLASIAIDFQTSISAIHNAEHRITWKHVP